MKKILFLAAVVVMAAACGGPAQDDFAKATPSFDAVALDISAADAVPENFEASASGGQSPSAALDAALELKIPCGGWCPKGRLAEDGPVPQRYPLQLGGPTTRRGLTTWLALAAAALAAALVLALQRRRGVGVVVFGATALVLTLLELYTTWVGDPLEVQRHLVGTLSRLSVILVVIIASAVDVGLDAWRSRPPREDQPPPPAVPWEDKFEAEYGSRVSLGA